MECGIRELECGIREQCGIKNPNKNEGMRESGEQSRESLFPSLTFPSALPNSQPGFLLKPAMS